MPQGQVRRPAQGCLAGKRRDLRPGGFSDADLDSEQDLVSGGLALLGLGPRIVARVALSG